MQIDIKQLEIPPGNRVRIRGLSWKDFEQFLDETGDDRHTRIWYYKGEMEVMSPEDKHEEASRYFDHLISTFCRKTGVDIGGRGSTTLKDADKAVGKEPDKSFYLGEHAIGKKIGDSKVPDLVLEVDNTTDSTQKLDDYKALGVPEVWIYGVDSQELSIRQLKDGEYSKSEESLYLPDKVVNEIKADVKLLQAGNSENFVLDKLETWTLADKESLKAEVEKKLEKAFEQQEKMQETQADTKQNTLDATNNTSKDLSAEAKVREAFKWIRGDKPEAVKEELNKDAAIQKEDASKSKSDDRGMGL